MYDDNYIFFIAIIIGIVLRLYATGKYRGWPIRG